MPTKKSAKGKKKAPKKKLDVVQKEWAEQSVEEKSNTVEQVCKAFKDMGMKGVDVVVARETQSGENTFSVEHLAAVGSVSDAQGKELNSYLNLMDVFDKFEVEVTSVVVGCKLPFLVSAFNLENEENPILEDRRGKVVFIQFWTPYNPRCIESVEALMAVAKKRQADWAGKVEILTIACDTNMEKLNEKLKEKGWTGDSKGSNGVVQHLWGGDNPEDEDEDGVITKYEIESLPECFMVDAQGVLLKRADPEDFTFETAVDSILAGGTELKSLPPPAAKDSWQAQTPEKRAEITENVRKVLKSDPTLKDVLMVATEAEIHDAFGGVRTELDVMLVGKVNVRFENNVHKVMNAFTKDGGIADVEKTVVVTATEGPVVPSADCSKCKTSFASMDAKSVVRWHCSMCPGGYTVCDDCEPLDKEHGSHHPLFRLGPGVEKDDLEKAHYGLGSFAVCLYEDDQKPKSGGCKDHDHPDGGACGSSIVHDDVFCNGCKEGPISGGPRWKCGSCADYDLCDGCYQGIVAHSEGPKAARRQASKGAAADKPVKHQRNHFFVRINDSSLVQIAGDEDDGDEGDMDPEEEEEMLRQMAEENGIEDIDTDAILAKLRAMGHGEIDEGDDSDEENADRLNQLAEQATKVALPDDDF